MSLGPGGAERAVNFMPGSYNLHSHRTRCRDVRTEGGGTVNLVENDATLQEFAADRLSVSMCGVYHAMFPRFQVD